MLLCSPIEFQVASTFSRHLNYKYVPESDQLQGYLINNQLMVASQNSNVFHHIFLERSLCHVPNIQDVAIESSCLKKSEVAAIPIWKYVSAAIRLVEILYSVITENIISRYVSYENIGLDQFSDKGPANPAHSGPSSQMWERRLDALSAPWGSWHLWFVHIYDLNRLQEYWEQQEGKMNDQNRWLVIPVARNFLVIFLFWNILVLVRYCE